MFLFDRSTCGWLMVAGLLAIPAAAQPYQFDSSGNARLAGSYFVREVLFTNINPQGGTVGTAISAVGSMTFDGAGGYVFDGNVMDSNPPSGEPQQTTRIIQGGYAVGANGFLRIDSLVGTYIGSGGGAVADQAFGGVGAAGPNAFVASTTEAGTNYNLFMGIPMSASVTNASFKATYNTAYLDLLNGDITKIRNATFALAPDGNGNLGNVAVSGYAADQGSTLLSQTALGATYTIAGVFATGGGVMSFHTSSNLVNGDKAFAVSPDGALVLGGSLTDFDMLVGTPAIPNATAALYKTFYFLGALEDDASLLATQGQSTVDTFYGSSSVTGAGGIFINHFRLAYPGYYPYDFTYDDTYTVPASGIFQPSIDPDVYMLGANGQVVVMSGEGTWYSLMVGLQAPADTAGGVDLNPLGIVNAANFAPATNPVAPLEMVILFGNGMASADFDALTLPVPTETPDHVQVLVNGIAAPIFRVRANLNPQLIYALVPSSVTPANDVYYATFQVVNNGAPSKSVTLYTNYIAPGVFAISQGGVGDAAALDGNTLITPSTPAKVADTIELFVDGLGSVSPPIVPDGAGALAVPPYNLVEATTTIAIDGWSSSLPFVGMAPNYTGLYQVNMTIPSVPSNDWYLDLDVYNPQTGDQGEAVEATISVASAASAASVTGHTAAVKRPARALHRGVPALNGRTPVSGRLTHTAQ